MSEPQRFLKLFITIIYIFTVVKELNKSFVTSRLSEEPAMCYGKKERNFIYLLLATYITFLCEHYNSRQICYNNIAGGTGLESKMFFLTPGNI